MRSCTLPCTTNRQVVPEKYSSPSARAHAGYHPGSAADGAPGGSGAVSAAGFERLVFRVDALDMTLFTQETHDSNSTSCSQCLAAGLARRASTRAPQAGRLNTRRLSFATIP